MKSHTNYFNGHYVCFCVFMIVLFFIKTEQFGSVLNAQIYPGWRGESSHIALSFGVGQEFSFVDYAEPFFSSIPVPLMLSSSLTQQYSLLVSLRKDDPLHIGRNSRYKYVELGFGVNVLHRTNQGKGEQQTQVIRKADSLLQPFPVVREVDVSTLSVGISGIFDMPTYIIDKLRVRFEPYVNIIVWDKSQNIVSLSNNDTSVVLPSINNVIYSTSGRAATLESEGNRTFGMIYSLKLGISYSILILLRDTPWLWETGQYGEIQPYFNFTLSSALTLSRSHRLISGFQIGVRFTVPYGLFDDESDHDPRITY